MFPSYLLLGAGDQFPGEGTAGLEKTLLVSVLWCFIEKQPEHANHKKAGIHRERCRPGMVCLIIAKAQRKQ